MLEVSGVSKSYGNRAALSDVSFAVGAGVTLGLLGPNGAGKSTAVNIIAGILSPDCGDVRVAGQRVSHDRDPAKRLIGFVPQDLALFDELPALDNLRLCGALYGLAGAQLAERIAAVLDLVGLGDRSAESVGAFSGGMKRRLNIAAALLHEPRLLLLDEPTVGVDPQSRNAIFDNLETLRRAGLTLVYTTHYMEEAERLCDRIVIIDHGKVLADDTGEGLRAIAGTPNASLEDVFLELTGRALRDR